MTQIKCSCIIIIINTAKPLVTLEYLSETAPKHAMLAFTYIEMVMIVTNEFSVHFQYGVASTQWSYGQGFLRQVQGCNIASN